MLASAERFRETRDDFVERSLIAAFYCAAQRLDRGVYPPIEKLALLIESVFLLCNKVAHDLAQRGDVILRLADLLAARETEARELCA